MQKTERFKQQYSVSRCIPELVLEVVEVKGVMEFAEATDACSEGLPLSVKELMAHLHGNDNWVNAKFKDKKHVKTAKRNSLANR